MSLRRRILSMLGLMCFTSIATAEPVSIIPIGDILNHPFWQKAKDALQLALFEAADEIDFTLYEKGHFDFEIMWGRVILAHPNGLYHLADHFGSAGRWHIPVGGSLQTGGSGGFTLTRLRPIPKPEDADKYRLKDELRGWDPHAPASARIQRLYAQNLEEEFSTLKRAAAQGDERTLRNFFGDGRSKKDYLDLTAGLRLPRQMPYTADHVLDDSRFHVNDQAHFTVSGGVFARLGTNENATGRAWVSWFIRGHFRITVLKTDTQQVLFRIDSGKEWGRNFRRFELRFAIPLNEGALSGRDGRAITFTPVRLGGENYRSRNFSRTYAIDLSEECGRDAYDAALHGNLTLLDDHAEASTCGVRRLVEEFQHGRHRRGDVKMSLGLLKLTSRKELDLVRSQYLLDAGLFERVDGHSLRRRFTAAKLGHWQADRLRENFYSGYLFTRNPAGTCLPVNEWSIEDINFKATPQHVEEAFDFLHTVYPAATQTLQEWKHAMFTRPPRTALRMSVRVLLNESALPKLLSAVKDVSPSAGLEHLMKLASRAGFKPRIPGEVLAALSPEDRLLEMELENDLAKWHYTDGELVSDTKPLCLDRPYPIQLPPIKF